MNTVSEQGGKPGWWVTFALLAFVFVMLAGLCSPMFMVLSFFAGHTSESDQTRFRIPGTEFELEHSRQLSAMCEFNRQLTYYSNGKKGAKTPLMYDTAGGYPINCYLIKVPGRYLLRLDDAVSEHVLDLSEQKTYMIVRTSTGAYYGDLPGDGESWGGGNSGPAHIGNREATPLAKLTLGETETYIGTLGGALGELRFYDADELPEPKIQYLNK